MRFKILFLLISVITIFGFTNLSYTECVGAYLTEKEEDIIESLPFYGYSFETSNKIYFILHYPCPYVFVNKEGKIEFIFKPEQFHPDNMVSPPFLIGKSEYIDQYKEKYKYEIKDINLKNVLFITKIPNDNDNNFLKLFPFKVNKDKLYEWTDQNEWFIKTCDNLENILTNIDKRLGAELAWQKIIQLEETKKVEIKWQLLNNEIKQASGYSPPTDELRIQIPPSLPKLTPLQIGIFTQSEIIKNSNKFENLCPSYKNKEKIMIIYPIFEFSHPIIIIYPLYMY